MSKESLNLSGSEISKEAREAAEVVGRMYRSNPLNNYFDVDSLNYREAARIIQSAIDKALSVKREQEETNECQYCHLLHDHRKTRCSNPDAPRPTPPTREQPHAETGEPDWLNEFHRANAARQHEAFAPAHSLQALVNCVAEEVGELAGAVSGVTGEKKRKAHLTNDDVLDAVADAITYLSLVADRAGCSDLQGLLARTFNMVSNRAGSLIKVREQGSGVRASQGPTDNDPKEKQIIQGGDHNAKGEEPASPLVSGEPLGDLIRDLLTDVMQQHADPDDREYNDCDKEDERCMWCINAAKVLASLTPSPTDADTQVEENNP